MKISVLGLGKSLTYYRYMEKKSIGVNDVFKYKRADIIVCVDPPRRFIAERLETIKSGTQTKFLTPYKEWNGIVNGFKLIKLAPVRRSLEEFENKNIYCYSNNSTFVAVHQAFKMGATEIIMYGVDLIDHVHLNGTQAKNEALLNDFRAIGARLNSLGVTLKVYNKSSLLSRILPYINKNV